MNKLEKKGIRILNEARTLGRAKTRDELKRQGIAFKAVTSPRSMEIHEGNWKEFSKWASDEGYKSLKKIDEDVIKKFLIEKSLSGGRSGNGASVKTLKSYITSINKVMSAGNLWTDEDKIKLKGIKEIKITDEQKSVYKKVSPDEWKEAHKRSYKSNQSYIDTLSSFGLRRREMSDLGVKSFVVDKNNKIYVQTVGKGGKARLAESTVKGNEAMLKLYGDKALRVDDIETFKNNLSSEQIMKFGREEPLNLKQSNNHKIPSHIFRSEYAQTLLKEKISEYSDTSSHKAYTTISKEDMGRDIETTIKGHTGSVRAFYEVSVNLGHNRLDVLTKYI